MALPKKGVKKNVTEEPSVKESIDLLDEYIQLEKQMAMKKGEDIVIGKMTDFESTGRQMHSFTNVLGIDINTHGWKRGDMISIAGAESAGKSSFVLSCVEGIQMHSPKDVFLIVDAEGTMSETFADRIPYLDRDRVRFMSGESMEKTFDRLIDIAEKGIVDWIIIDSLDTLVSEAELEKSLEDSVMFRRAAVISRALAKLMPILKKKKTGLILIQQLRTSMKGHIVTEDTSGGKAVKYYASARLFLGVDKSKSEIEKDTRTDQDIPRINAVKMKSQKNKLNRPQVTTYSYLNVFPGSETASNRIKDVIEYATSTIIGLDSNDKEIKMARMAGAWINLTDPTTGEEFVKFNGKKDFERALSEDINLYSKLKMFIYGCNIDPAMFIVKFDEIRKMIIKENELMKERKVKISKRKGKDEPSFEELELSENVEDYMTIEGYEEGTFKLMSPEERDAYINQMDSEKAEELQKIIDKKIKEDKINEELGKEDVESEEFLDLQGPIPMED